MYVGGCWNVYPTYVGRSDKTLTHSRSIFLPNCINYLYWRGIKVGAFFVFFIGRGEGGEFLLKLGWAFGMNKRLVG